MQDKCPAVDITSLFLYLVGCETEAIIDPALVSATWVVDTCAWEEAQCLLRRDESPLAFPIVTGLAWVGRGWIVWREEIQT